MNYLVYYLLFPATSIMNMMWDFDINSAIYYGIDENYKKIIFMMLIVDILIYYLIFEFIIKKIEKKWKYGGNLWVFYILYLLLAVYAILRVKSSEINILIFIPWSVVVSQFEEFLMEKNPSLVIGVAYLLDVGFSLFVSFLFYKLFRKKVSSKIFLMIFLICLLIVYIGIKTFITFLMWGFSMSALHS